MSTKAPLYGKARIQAEIERYRSACGCEAAASFMLGATVAFLAYVAIEDPEWATSTAVWRGGVWVLSFTVIGKLLGLTHARVRLRLLRSALDRESVTPG